MKYPQSSVSQSNRKQSEGNLELRFHSSGSAFKNGALKKDEVTINGGGEVDIRFIDKILSQIMPIYCRCEGSGTMKCQIPMRVLTH